MPGNTVDCKLADDDVAAGRHGGQHRVADPALRVVVLNGHDAAAAGSGVLLDGLDVQRLDGERVQHARIHALVQKKCVNLVDGKNNKLLNECSRKKYSYVKNYFHY